MGLRLSWECHAYGMFRMLVTFPVRSATDSVIHRILFSLDLSGGLKNGTCHTLYVCAGALALGCPSGHLPLIGYTCPGIAHAICCMCVQEEQCCL